MTFKCDIEKDILDNILLTGVNFMPKLFGVEAHRMFATVRGGTYYVFHIEDSVRVCHESNSFLVWE